jgi:hypothetical protein
MINGVLQKPRLEQSWGSTRSGNFQPSTKLTLPGRGPLVQLETKIRTTFLARKIPLYRANLLKLRTVV